MKNNLTISLDQEIVTKLKAESNYSDVINEQLKAFYAIKTCTNQAILKENLAKTKQILKENRQKRREIEAQLLKIDKKNKLFKKKMLSRSKMILEVIRRRKSESNSTRRIQYFITPEEEVDKLLQGGVQ